MSVSIHVDCKCGWTMQEQKIEDLEGRFRLYFKCFRCGNEVVVNSWK